MTARPDSILRIAKVVEKAGMSKATIYRRIKEGKFPAPLELSTNIVGWRESEIE
jgi:prophage regulatory protein